MNSSIVIMLKYYKNLFKVNTSYNNNVLQFNSSQLAKNEKVDSLHAIAKQIIG